MYCECMMYHLKLTILLMTTLYFWIGLGVFFLILESLTATFYGLALALASTFVALYVWIVGDTSITLVQ